MSELSKYFSDTRKAAPLRKKSVIFVFGSNEAGVHGAGAARAAHLHHGAVYGKGIGHYGNSYAIPTKDHNIMTLPYSDISKYVNDFIDYAEQNPKLTFHVTQIGCGLAGLKTKRMAEMFFNAPHNCFFDSAWEFYLHEDTLFWGTHP